MLSIIAFRFGYNKRKNLNQLKTPSTISDLDKNKLELKLTYRTILFLIAPCLFLLAQFEYDFIALQFRGLGEQLENVFLFELFFLKPFIFNIFFFYILILKKSSKKHTFKKLVFLFGLLFFTGPLSVPRFLSFCLFYVSFFRIFLPFLHFCLYVLLSCFSCFSVSVPLSQIPSNKHIPNESSICRRYFLKNLICNYSIDYIHYCIFGTKKLEVIKDRNYWRKIFV